MLTVHSLGAGGRNYGRMPKRVVIFLCDVDVEKRGEAVYDYSRRSADGRMLGDGGRIVFVNGEYSRATRKGRSTRKSGKA